MDDRISRDDAAMLTAFAWALRSSCRYYLVGCAILSADYELIGQGYNGTPHGMPNCIDANCAKRRGNRCEGLHGERNAIYHVHDRQKLVKATLYTSLQPCVECSLFAVQVGLGRIVAGGRYLRQSVGDDDRVDDIEQAMSVLERAGIQFDWYQPESQYAIDQTAHFMQYRAMVLAGRADSPEL